MTTLWSPWIFLSTLGIRDDHYLYFTDVETEAQRGWWPAMSPGLLTGVRPRGPPGCSSPGLHVPGAPITWGTELDLTANSPSQGLAPLVASFC